MIPSPQGATRLYAVLGDPVAQVQAPQLLNTAFLQAGADAVMVPVHVRAGDLASVVDGLKRIANLDGIVVTIPHKFDVCALVDRLSPTVALTGSANALRREPDGAWSAENFDGTGFVAGLIGQGHDPKRRKVALVGAGGAGVAIAAALVQAEVAWLTISDLSELKARALVDRLQAHHPGVAAFAAAPPLAEVDMVVNATPVGLRPDDPLPFELDALTPDAVVADIIMKPAETRLLKAARQRGLAVHPGIHMLMPQIALYCRFFGIGAAERRT